MDSKTSLAPLTLLLGTSAAETTDGLRFLLADNDEFALAHIAAPHASSFDIVHHGVSLRLAVNPQFGDLTGLKGIFCNLDTASLQSCLEIQLGEHVAGGERVPAIIQGLLDAARKLGLALGAIAAVGRPADIVSGFDYFSEAVADYLAGGAFPVLAMVNFKAAPGGNIDSRGLEFLAGQELHIVGNNMEQADLMRRVVRVVHDIAVNGPIHEAFKLVGIEPDETIELQPNAAADVLTMIIHNGGDA